MLVRATGVKGGRRLRGASGSQRRMGWSGSWRSTPLSQGGRVWRSEEHTSELQSLRHLVCRLLLEKKHTSTRPLQHDIAAAGGHVSREGHGIGGISPGRGPRPVGYVPKIRLSSLPFFIFFNDTATTEIYTLSLHDALPILRRAGRDQGQPRRQEIGEAHGRS